MSTPLSLLKSRPVRRWCTAAAACAIAGAVVLLHACGDGLSGSTFAAHEPAVVASSAGVLTTVLTVQQTTTTLGGVTFSSATYNGAIPGPTLRVRPGDTMHIHLDNTLAPAPIPLQAAPTGCASGTCACATTGLCVCNPTGMCQCAAFSIHGHRGTPPPGVCATPTVACACGAAAAAAAAPPVQALAASGSANIMQMGDAHVTNMHFHGLHVDPTGASDNVFVSVAPGAAFDYTVQIPANHPAGLYWYHPHLHGLVTEQLQGGLEGAIIVAGDIDAIPEVAAARERLMVLSEIALDANGNVAGAATPEPITRYLPINGRLMPDIDARPGEVQRWRIVSANGDRFFKLALEGHQLYQIALDGQTFAAPVARDSILMMPGNRIEVLVKVSASAGSYQLKTLSYNRGVGGPSAEVVMATMTVAGVAVEGILPTTLLPPPPLATDPPMPTRYFGFVGLGTSPLAFGINGQAFDPTATLANPTVNTTEDWLIYDGFGEDHPFHIHAHPFQVIALAGMPVANPVWQDTAIVPKFSSMIVRIPFRDFTGRSVFHCHITSHEDLGMMGVFEVGP